MRSKNDSLQPVGMTLMELVVTLALIGFIAAVVTLAFPADLAPSSVDPLVRIGSARTTAVEEARMVTISIPIGGRLVDVSAMPDGSIITDPAFRVQRLSGR